jgi:hypothetical protein
MPFATYAPVTGADPINTVTGGFLRFQGAGPVVERVEPSGSVTVSTAGTYVVEYSFDRSTFGELTFNGITAPFGAGGSETTKFPLFVDSSASVTFSFNDNPNRGYIRIIDISERLDLSDVASTHSIPSGGTLPVSELSYVVGGLPRDAFVDDPNGARLATGESCNFLTDVDATFSIGGVVTKIPLTSLISTNFTLISKQLNDNQTHSVSGDRLITSPFTDIIANVDGGTAEIVPEGIMGRLTLVNDTITADRDLRLVGMEF